MTPDPGHMTPKPARWLELVDRVSRFAEFEYTADVWPFAHPTQGAGWSWHIYDGRRGLYTDHGHETRRTDAQTAAVAAIRKRGPR